MMLLIVFAVIVAVGVLCQFLLVFSILLFVNGYGTMEITLCHWRKLVREKTNRNLLGGSVFSWFGSSVGLQLVFSQSVGHFSFSW